MVDAVRAAGARIKFISDGDVAGAIMAARDGTGVDLLAGIGGTPEGIIAACAISCLGGMIQSKLWPRDEAERRKALDAGHDLDRVLTTTDLVTGENIFFCATGITDGELMEGVRYTPAGPTTHSIVMRVQERHDPRGPQRAPPRQAVLVLGRGLLDDRHRPGLPRGPLSGHAFPWNRLHRDLSRTGNDDCRA